MTVNAILVLCCIISVASKREFQVAFKADASPQPLTPSQVGSFVQAEIRIQESDLALTYDDAELSYLEHAVKRVESNVGKLATVLKHKVPSVYEGLDDFAESIRDRATVLDNVLSVSLHSAVCGNGNVSSLKQGLAELRSSLGQQAAVTASMFSRKAEQVVKRFEEQAAPKLRSLLEMARNATKNSVTKGLERLLHMASSVIENVGGEQMLIKFFNTISTLSAKIALTVDATSKTKMQAVLTTIQSYIGQGLVRKSLDVMPIFSEVTPQLRSLADMIRTSNLKSLTSSSVIGESEYLLNIANFQKISTQTLFEFFNNVSTLSAKIALAVNDTSDGKKMQAVIAQIQSRTGPYLYKSLDLISTCSKISPKLRSLVTMIRATKKFSSAIGDSEYLLNTTSFVIETVGKRLTLFSNKVSTLSAEIALTVNDTRASNKMQAELTTIQSNTGRYLADKLPDLIPKFGKVQRDRVSHLTGLVSNAVNLCIPRHQQNLTKKLLESITSRNGQLYNKIAQGVRMAQSKLFKKGPAIKETISDFSEIISDAVDAIRSPAVTEMARQRLGNETMKEIQDKLNALKEGMTTLQKGIRENKTYKYLSGLLESVTQKSSILSRVRSRVNTRYSQLPELRKGVRSKLKRFLR